MTGLGDEESQAILSRQRLDRTGLVVTVDKGYMEGRYCVWVEFDELAQRVGFAAARRLARQYCELLRGQLSGAGDVAVGEIEDGSRTAGPGRKRDLEATFLSFDLGTGDGRYHDRAIGEQFRVASLRAGQAWDQSQAKVQEQRRGNRQEGFRRQLAELLDGEAYARVDAATKKRLLSEVPALAFRPRGMGR
jgi:hypothetical protein